jgi:flagellar biogenesis protein FliO
MAWAWPVAGFADAANSPAAPMPDLGVSVLRVFGALVLVLALFLGGVWLFKNSQRALGRSNGVNKLHVLEVKSLGNRQSLCVIGYGRQRMLVSSSPAGVSLVSQLPEAMPEELAAAPPPNFADALQSILHRKP